MANSSATSRASNGGAGDATATTTEHVAGKAHEAIDRIAQNTADAELKVRERAEAAANRVRETEERARAAADHSIERVSGYIQSNPLMSAGMAFAAGVVLSKLLQR
jgi:ElaB/YqjD/DUF883 family membrane-anchored ribosome-binding protein